MSKQGGKPSAATAKVYTHQSNRKARDPNESKTVFKAVLDNPFQIKWPQIPANVENAILARVIELLQGVAEYNMKRRSDSRQVKNLKKPRRGKTSKSKDVVMADAGEEVAQDGPSMVPAPLDTETDELMGEPSSKKEAPLVAPDILRFVSVGINDVTKRLEAQSRTAINPPTVIISAQREDEMPDATLNAAIKIDAPIPRSPVRVVLVCKADIDPPMLINHIPYLVASCNSNVRTGGEPIRLVTLPKGAELALAQAFGLRRAAIMSLDEDAATDPMLRSLLDSVPPIVAPWVVGPLPAPPLPKAIPAAQRKLAHNRKELLPTNIQQIRTTMPKDMKAHKAKRAKERAEAKKRRKERMTKETKVGTKAEMPNQGAYLAADMVALLNK